MSNRAGKWLIIAIAAVLVVLGYLETAGQARSQQSVIVPAHATQIAIAGTVAVRTSIISGVSGKSIYVTALQLTPVATAVVTFSYGTGTNCGTGTGTLSGALTFAAGQTVNFGNGNGAVMVVPAGNDLCITIATAASPGIIAYAQF